MNFKIAQDFREKQLTHHTQAYTLTRPCYTDRQITKTIGSMTYMCTTDKLISQLLIPPSPPFLPSINN